jgi:cyanophycin synthetase
MLADSERTARIVSITGTNGKTTTTRLLAHIATTAGSRTGWSSSSGVYVDGQTLIEGDYSGPSGARMALEAPGVEVAVLETARGGILLKGIAYQSNDVSVFTNVSADHLDLHGVRTIEGLARTKAVVCQITRPEGTAVANASDPLVLDATRDIRARRLLFALTPDEPALSSHLEGGGDGVFVEEGWFVLQAGGQPLRILEVAAAPVTLGGAAQHMTMNALAAIGAAHGLGLGSQAIARGLKSFHNSAEMNQGRLNLYDVEGVTVILDFAHNEAGLSALLQLARGMVSPGGALISVIGTAGDRTAQSIRALGRIAAEMSDRIIVKESHKYLRGRTVEEMTRLYLDGLRQGPVRPHEVNGEEFEAFERALAYARPGDVVALMAQEESARIIARLEELGVPRA